jgi:hypothetical protein
MKDDKGSIPRRTYSALFLLSLTLFLVNFLVQGHILFSYNDYYGLISKMNWIYWLGYALMIGLIFFHYVNFKRLDERYAYLTILLAIIYLISTPFLYESLPRFEDTWAHSRLADIFYKTGESEGTGYAYEQYPGSFIFYGILFNLFNSFYVMRFFPFLFYIVGAIVIYLTLKDLTSPQKAFLIVVIYMLFSWTVEDNHISPQFLALNLYFIFMFFTIKLLKGGKNRILYMTVIALLAFVISFSHMLTPIFLILILSSIYIFCKKFRKAVLPILIIIVASFLIHEMYFSNFLSSFVENLQNIEGLFSVSSKFAGAYSLDRQIFIGSRLAILATSIILGFLGIRTLYNRGQKITSMLLFSWAFSMLPFLILISMFLNGEFAERFALISSLPLAIAATYFLTYRKAQVIVLVLLIVLSPLYFVSKYGNEAFESQSVEKLKVDCFSNTFESDCEEKSVIVNSPLTYLDELGTKQFSVTREGIMFSQIYGSNQGGNVFDTIKRIENEKGLDKIYSTNDAWFYISK